MPYLNISQVTDILRAAYKSSRRDHLMLLLSFQHGLRASEVANLRLGDVQDGLIRVDRVKGSLKTVQALITSQNILFDEPKTLVTWLAERQATTDALFPSRKNVGHMKPNTIGKIAKLYMLRSGIPAEFAHHHSLKHAACSLLIRSGVGLELVKQFAGHASISSTIHYVHISDEEAISKAQSVFNTVISNGRP